MTGERLERVKRRSCQRGPLIGNVVVVKVHPPFESGLVKRSPLGSSDNRLLGVPKSFGTEYQLDVMASHPTPSV